jgi:hypothetical protein
MSDDASAKTSLHCVNFRLARGTVFYPQASDLQGVRNPNFEFHDRHRRGRTTRIGNRAKPIISINNGKSVLMAQVLLGKKEKAFWPLIMLDRGHGVRLKTRSPVNRL